MLVRAIVRRYAFEVTKPWLDINPSILPAMPAMLWQEEKQFLYWLGMQSDNDAIVDLGTFLGASAACLAAGVEASGSNSHIFSYDLFTFGPWCKPYGMDDGW